ncbi:MAG: glycosyltransferase family 2 protein [Lachnospiraceae bacterium]|nr:glycosyltransferase family 2 protein [Lachnospiraceae bacterium]
MTFELLVSCVQKDARELAEKMNIASDAVILSQMEDENTRSEFDLDGRRVRVIKSSDKGVGLSRDICIAESDADVILFSDEDIVYEEGYEAKVLKEFADHPDADLILFNVRVCEERKTYWNEGFKRVRWYNCGRYPAYSIAARNTGIKRTGVRFSLLFGGGAKYSNGEDSLFLMHSLKAGLRIFSTDVCIGEEVPRPSTWFHGYTDKYFFDRGVLYHFLYGKAAKLLGCRWLLKTKRDYSGEYDPKKAKMQLYKGIKEGIKVEKSL